MELEQIQFTGNLIKLNETGPEKAKRELESFAYNIGLNELAKLYGIETLPADTKERLKALQKIAEEHWDFRRGVERQAVEWEAGEDALNDPESEQWATVFDAANKLGILESSRPKNTHPDYLIYLGGANRSPLDRLKYALESVDDYGTLVGIGSSRLVGDGERVATDEYSPEAKTEFDLMCSALEAASLDSKSGIVDLEQHGEDVVFERNGDTWRVRAYSYSQYGREKTAYILGTPHQIHRQSATDNPDRATTYDNYDFFARAVELDKTPGASIVAATTGMYVMGQHIPGLQVLVNNYSAELETIGHDAAYTGKKRLPKQLLQEIKAAVDAAVRLESIISENGKA